LATCFTRDGRLLPKIARRADVSSLRQVREVLRLAQAKSLSPTEIAIAAHLPRTTIRNYLSRAAAAGRSWPLPDDLDDPGLEERLFGRPSPPPAILARPVPVNVVLAHTVWAVEIHQIRCIT
jgi:hypothetical protein